MLYFLLIMVIFLLAYGVAQQAILHPNEEPSWSVVSGVFFRPYFQVYGELFVETPDTSKHGLFSLTTGTPNDRFLGNDLKWLVMHPGVL